LQIKLSAPLAGLSGDTFAPGLLTSPLKLKLNASTVLVYSKLLEAQRKISIGRGGRKKKKKKR